MHQRTWYQPVDDATWTRLRERLKSGQIVGTKNDRRNQMHIELLAITPNAEELIERAGRTAHQSLEHQKVDSTAKFVRMLIKRGHHSVIEHASATFRVLGISRACTHQLVRHRLCSFTQQSQRYVNEDSFKYVVPKAISDNPEAIGVFRSFISQARWAYKQLHYLGIKNEDARFVLPNATQSEIVITANFREWRHIIQSRGSAPAQWEIREVAIAILRRLKEEAPNVFADLEIDEETRTVYRRRLRPCYRMNRN